MTTSANEEGAVPNTVSVVSDVDNKKYKLVMKGDMRSISVGKIKKHLAAHCKLPVEEQLLTFNGTVLADTATGQQVGLFPGAQLRLARQPRSEAVASHQPRSPYQPASPSQAGAPPAHAQAAPQATAQPRSQQPYWGGDSGAEQQRQVYPSHLPPAPVPEGGNNLGTRVSPNRLNTSVPESADAAAMERQREALVGSFQRERELEERCSRLQRENARCHEDLAAAQQHVLQKERELDTALRDNDRLQHDVAAQRRELEVRHPRGMSPRRAGVGGLQLARQNLAEFGQELGVQHELDFDENMTCVVGVEQKYTILLTYDQSTDRLYVYSTLLTYLPPDEKLRLRLFEALLEGALLGRDMAGGGVGVSVKNELILMATSIDLRHSDSSALRELAPVFVECLIKWRAGVKGVLERHARASGVLPHPEGGAPPLDAPAAFGSAPPPRSEFTTVGGGPAPLPAHVPPVSPASYARASASGAVPGQWQGSSSAMQQLEARERELAREQQLLQRQRSQLQHHLY